MAMYPLGTVVEIGIFVLDHYRDKIFARHILGVEYQPTGGSSYISSYGVLCYR